MDAAKRRSRTHDSKSHLKGSPTAPGRKPVRLKSVRAKPAPLPGPDATPQTTSQGEAHEPALLARTAPPPAQTGQAAVPAIPPLQESGISFLYDAALANNHEAQYELARRFEHGSKGAAKSQSQSRYWLSRAAAGQHEAACDLILERSGSHGKKRLLLQRQACADHASFKLGNSTDAQDIFEKSLRLQGLDSLQKSAVIEGLFAVPENRPWLEMAACMLKDGLINDILVRPQRDSDGARTGSFNSWLGRIKILVGPEDVCQSLMHELTHAVMFELHRNDVKSYASTAQKRDLKRALDASRAGENRALTPLEHQIALYMNSPFLSEGYDGRRSYKIEREVRIGALLSANYAAKKVFEKDYPLEWKRYLRQAQRCQDWLAKRAHAGKAACHFRNPSQSPWVAAPQRPDHRHVAAAVIDRALGSAFGDVRWKKGNDVLRARNSLADALEKAGLSVLEPKQLDRLCDKLAALYAPCFSGTPRKRHFDVDGLDQVRLASVLSLLPGKRALPDTQSDELVSSDSDAASESSASDSSADAGDRRQPTSSAHHSATIMTTEQSEN